jgi:hypothetical protein
VWRNADYLRPELLFPVVRSSSTAGEQIAIARATIVLG